MFKQIVLVSCVVVLLSSQNAQAGGAAQNGFWNGAVGGAIVGQVVGHNTKSTLIGTAIGGVLGYMVGNEVDKEQGQPPQTYYQPNQTYQPLQTYRQPRVVTQYDYNDYPVIIQNSPRIITRQTVIIARGQEEGPNWRHHRHYDRHDNRDWPREEHYDRSSDFESRVIIFR